MDKYEFRISLQEINKLITEQRFDEASSIADTIDWTRVKSAETLCKISDVYKINGEYEKSRSVLALANTRDPKSADIIYSLCELTIYLYGRDGLQSDLTSALSLMTNYQALQPENPRRLILQYKFYNVSSVSLQEKIDVLERLKEENYSARWGYELALLQHQAGADEAALAECRSVINNFGGKYAVKAQDLMSAIMAENAGRPAAKPAAERAQVRQEQEAEPAAAPAENQEEAGEKPSPATEDISVARAQENQALDASLRRNIASGMKDIYARPFDEKIAQEPGGQYVMVQEEKEKEEKQTEGQLSISEVMKEWEKIRGNIRHANDQKRLQKMMEDTGPIMQDFDETAKHGLLEDIEKNVARNQRYAKTMVYRDASGSSYRVAPRRDYGYDDQEYDRYDQGYDSYEQGYAQENAYPEENGRYEENPEYTDYEAPYEETAPAEEPAEDVYEEPAAEQGAAEYEEESGLEQEAYGESPDAEEPADVQDAGEEAGTPVTQEAEEDIRIAPSRDPEATRKWDAHSIRRAEEIRRAVAEAQEKMKAEEAANTAAEAPAAENEQVQPHAGAAAGYDEEYVEDHTEAWETEETEGAAPYEEPAKEPAGEEEPAEEETYEEESAGEETYEEEPAEEESYEEEPEAEPEDSAGEPLEEPAQETQEPEKEEDLSAGSAPRRKEHGKAPQASHDSHGARVLTPEERKMFGPFCVVKENRQQLIAALDKISLASWTGNVIITGGEATARRVAQGILEIERKSDNNFTGKIARASAAALSKLSRQKLDATLAQIENGAMIIEGAAGLAEETVINLYHQLEDKEHGLIVILLDTRKAMDEFTARYENYLGSFNARIDIKALNDKALVSYGLEYALSKDYSIDEFGQMALSSRIASMQTPDHHVTMKEVREIVDEAISYASKKSPKTMVDVLTRKRYDKDDRIIIHEKDFQHF